jgi:cytochrome c oxidase cbb3-type subunit 4
MTWTMIGLLFFFTFFMCMLAWVFRPGARKKYEGDAQIPFREDDHVQ